MIIIDYDYLQVFQYILVYIVKNMLYLKFNLIQV